MCELAPGKAECALERFDLTICYAHKLVSATTDFKQTIPIVGKRIPDYECPRFEAEVEQ